LSRKITFLLLLLILSFLLLAFKASESTIYSFKVKDIDDYIVDFSEYKGKVLVIINIACSSPLTPQLNELEAFYKKYKPKKVEVLAFPSNSFKSELKTNKEIRVFCRSKYKVSFTIFSKIEVKGKKQHPLFKYLSDKKENNVMDAPIKWDFQKYIIDKNGKLVNALSPTETINNSKTIKLINKILSQK
jgi:glutathione peroxidase